MFIRTTHIGIGQGNWDEALRRFKEQAIPHLESLPGFLRVIFSGDPNSGRATIITMWQNAQQGGGEGEGGEDQSLGALEGLLDGAVASSAYREILEREF